MAERRKAISKKVRFEVFKRDNFTCQYCGRMAPDVILEVDHINPVSNGGGNDIMNLITSCFDCNRGKGKKKLSQNDELKKQQEQLRELSTKREQLQMMLNWKNELINFENEQLHEFEERLCISSGLTLTDTGREKARKWIKQYGLLEVLECMDISIEQYFDQNNDATGEKTFSYIPRIASVRSRQKANPMIGKKNYIRAILRNRITYVNEKYLMQMLNEMKTEEDFEEVKLIATTCNHWTDFRETFNEWCGGDY